MNVDTPLITLGGVPLVRPHNTTRRLTLLLWGDAGTGKTTLAATAPGRKLWLNFDPEGTDSLTGIDEDIMVADFSAVDNKITESFKNETNPLNLKSVLGDFDTLIFDSITNITDKTLTTGIKRDSKGSTIETPSPRAYGTRNALAIRLVKNVIALTGKAQKHVVFIAHEGAPVTEDDTGKILYISLALGGQLPNNLGIDFSEMWSLYNVDNRAERRIMIRPSRKRKPAKTRMFEQSKEPEFTWGFDADHWHAHTNIKFRLDTWYALWMKANRKLPLPGTVEFDKLLKESLQ